MSGSSVFEKDEENKRQRQRDDVARDNVAAILTAAIIAIRRTSTPDDAAKLFGEVKEALYPAPRVSAPTEP